MTKQATTRAMEIKLAHSPDSDDAFMFYALATNKVRAEGLKFAHVLADIETLNRAAESETYDVTAVSFASYPYLKEKYALLDCGASFGEGYGPLRDWIARHMAGLGVLATAENIVITNGSQQALDFLGKLLISPGDGVLVTAPKVLFATTEYRPMLFDAVFGMMNVAAFAPGMFVIFAPAESQRSLRPPSRSEMEARLTASLSGRASRKSP